MICLKLYKKSMVEPYFFMKTVLFSVKTLGIPLKKHFAKLVGRIISEGTLTLKNLEYLKFHAMKQY